jgi:hypothetical protein
MKALLEGRYSPLTFCTGFLDAPYKTVVGSFAEWRRETREHVATRELKGRLPTLLKALEPLTMPPRRDLWAATKSPWVALFDNTATIADLASPIAYMSRRMKCRGLVVSSIPNTIGRSTNSKGTYGAVSFELFAPEDREFLNYERSVAAVNDGGRWTFVAEGSVQPFEETNAYKEKLIRNRFTPEMLERYCKALGISVFDEDFYGTEALLVESGRPTSDAVVVSLTQAQADIGLGVKKQS